MKAQEIKDFLIGLVDRELEEEYRFQIDSSNDKTYLKQLLQAKKYLMRGSKGIDRFAKNMALCEDIEKYLGNQK